MSVISKGVACRICKHNVQKECAQGRTESAHKPDDCWLFQNKKKNSGLAEHSDSKVHWSL